jgi:hypothetical protein
MVPKHQDHGERYQEVSMDISLTENERTLEGDRIRRFSPTEANRRIDTELERNIRFYSCQDKEAITERLRELDMEWDIERTLMANAASSSLFGVTMGLISSRKWLVLPLVVTSFLLQHSVQGWCPPLPLFRKLKIRTRSEIDQERYALKFLRGDFDNLERHEDGGFKRDVHRLVEDLRNGDPS